MLSDEFNVSESTIKRDANFATGLELIGKSNPDLKMSILQGKSDIKKKDIQFLATVQESPRFKNEADLYNKLYTWKNEVITRVEQELTPPVMDRDEEEPDVMMFPDLEQRL